MEQVPSCGNLEFHPTKKYKDRCSELVLELAQEDTSTEERVEIINELLGSRIQCGRLYEPYCTKLKHSCVVMTSPVMSQREFRGFYQHFNMSIGNSDRIETCEHRDLPNESKDGNEHFQDFLLNHLNPNY